MGRGVNTKLFSRAGLLLLAVLALTVTVAVNILFRGLRVDLTEDNLYTLSAGTVSLVQTLPEPVELTLYFSRRQTEEIPPLRNYARRVQELLQEYVQVSDGRLSLKIVDPEPFSEEEDQAASYGVQAVPLSAGGRTLYMGLVAVGAEKSLSHPEGEKPGRKSEVIPFLSPDKETSLEYDISNLIYSVSRASKPKVALISTLPVTGGGFDMATRQPSPPWMSIAQLNRLYEVEHLGQSVNRIPEDVTLLVLVLPNLPPETQYAVDQYVLGGGHALIFLDPYAEAGASGGGMMMGSGVQSAYLDTLMQAWGVEMVKDRFVADDKYALSVGSGAGGRPVRHLGILGFGRESLNTGDIITGNLKTVNLASAGALRLREGAGVSFEPLLSSSRESALLEAGQLAMMFDPKVLYRDFKPSGEQYTLAARISGQVKTAFPAGKPQKSEPDQEGDQPKTPPVAASTEPERPQLMEAQQPVNIIVVADTDVLSNRMWVQVSHFFGQQVTNPFASNGDMVVNMVDNLTGNADLISIRSRGQFSRPFTRVDDLERQAQARFLKTEEELNQQLQTTESRLMELQMKKQGQDALVLSEEQAEELARFKQEKLKIRKQLRNVQLQLNQEVERLGRNLKLLNILLVPALLTLLALIWRLRRRPRTA